MRVHYLDSMNILLLYIPFFPLFLFFSFGNETLLIFFSGCKKNCLSYGGGREGGAHKNLSSHLPLHSVFLFICFFPFSSLFFPPPPFTSMHTFSSPSIPAQILGCAPKTKTKNRTESLRLESERNDADLKEWGERSCGDLLFKSHSCYWGPFTLRIPHTNPWCCKAINYRVKGWKKGR